MSEVDETVEPETEGSEPTDTQATSEETPETTPKRSKKGFFVFLGTLLLIIVIVLLGSLLSKPKAARTETKAEDSMVRMVLTTQPGQLIIEASPEIWTASRLNNEDKDTTGRDVFVRELKESADSSRSWMSRQVSSALVVEGREVRKSDSVYFHNSLSEVGVLDVPGIGTITLQPSGQPGHCRAMMIPQGSFPLRNISVRIGRVPVRRQWRLNWEPKIQECQDGDKFNCPALFDIRDDTRI